jgi:uncharacterized protein DUF1549/uncharacterized protein DUF1553
MFEWAGSWRRRLCQPESDGGLINVAAEYRLKRMLNPLFKRKVSARRPRCLANSQRLAMMFLGLFFIGLLSPAQRSFASSGLVRISIGPEPALLFGQEATQQLLVTGHYTDGIERDVTTQARFSSTNPDIVSVDSKGRVIARRPGFTRISARLGNFAARARVLVVAKDGSDAILFERDVLPILTMKGCNGGNCHGSMHGKNGFKLSQFGYDAQLDYRMMALASQARRVNRLEPERSLILLKPTSTLPHGGGTRFSVDSQEFRILSKWIAQGAPGPGKGPGVRIDRLEVFPKERTLAAPGSEQQLVVLAHYTDRTVRDVTTEVTYVSQDESIVGASAGGLVKARRAGETSILIRGTGSLGLARLAVLGGSPIRNYPRVQTNNFIDQLVFDKLRRVHILPSELCSDEVFLRRAYLDTIGTLPTVREAREFLADRRGDKRVRLIDELLKRPEYADYWGLIWADLLTITAFKSGPSRTLYLDHWVRQQLRDNLPFDRFVRELIAGTGSIRENPGIALVVSRPPEQVASYFSQLFLGVRIQCAQCHDHPFEKWKRQDYLGMVAFFSQVGSRRHKVGTLVYDDLTKQTIDPRSQRPVAPQFLGEVAPALGSDFNADCNRRKALANWITSPNNPYFGRAMANRIWAHFMKVGLVEPVDDLRETNPSTNPELLEALGRYFVENGYDLKRLMKAIMNSRVYQLSSVVNATNHIDNQHYSHYYVRRIYAESLLDAVTQLTGAPHQFRFGYPGMKAVQAHDPVMPDSFLQTFDRNRRETTCQRDENVTLGQALALIASNAVNDKLRFRGGPLDQLIDSGLSNKDIVEELFLAALSRYPSPDEGDAVLEAIADSRTRRIGFEDVLWALVNSREFMFNH